MSVPKQALRQTATRITYKFQSHDPRQYYFDDVVNRMRSAAIRAGGEMQGGIQNAPRRIRRWTVLRSPHVNKKSREKFWMVTRLRTFHWDAPLDIVDDNVPTDIAQHIPATVAIRVIKDAPALTELKGVFDTIQTVRNGKANTDQSVSASTSDEKDGSEQVESNQGEQEQGGVEREEQSGSDESDKEKNS